MYGKIITELPHGFVPLQQWPEYDLAHLPLPTFNPELIDAEFRGIRWGFWPLMFEEYVGDTEPNMSRSDPTRHARNRVVMWRTLVRTDVPKGWHRIGHKISKLEGFAEITDLPYCSHWDESAKRYRNKWLRDHSGKTYHIEPIGYDEFRAAHAHSLVSKTIKSFFADQISRQSQGNTKRYYEFHAVKHTKTGQIAAAMCVLNSPTHKASYYVTGFYNPEHADVPAMIALMDRWFKESQECGIRFLHFGEFWIPGKPKSWKGFSLFKSKFGLQYIAHPPVLLRFAPGKLF